MSMNKKYRSWKALGLTAAVLLSVMMVGGLAGCSSDGKAANGNAAVSTSDAASEGEGEWYFKKNGFVIQSDFEVSEDFLDSQGFEYERAMAAKHYDPDSYEEPSESERNLWVDAYGTYAFDESGTGVFVVGEPEASGMNHYGFYIEYTSDYGKTWKIYDGCFYSTYGVSQIKLAGKKVYLVLNSYMEEKSYIMYSHDLCETFQGYDPAILMPKYKDLLYYHTMNMDILNVEEKDGSLILGWYDEGDYRSSVYEDSYYGGYAEKNYFLIAKADSKLSSCQVLYADDKHMKDTARDPSEY